mmetsp:Transcript_115802/g.334422  ORF Transcript_115802/g.334422 Transcript_115802/m.334422 type:complete len:326 (-) Transcript_115802:1068-2045(-)
MPRAEGDAQRGRVADLGQVEVGIRAHNLHRGIDGDARLPSRLEQLGDLVPVVLAPVEDVVPEERRDPRVCDGIGVAHQHLVIRERPMPLGAAGVVVVDEGHRVLRHPTNEARGLAVRVPQPPILAVAHGLLQDPLRCEIEGGARLIRGIDPVNQVLPVPILVVGKTAVVVVHVAPQLPDCPRRCALLTVQTDELRRVALDEVEPPSVETDLELQPSQPNADALLHALVLVVDVGRCIEFAIEAAGVVLACSIGELISERDGPSAPVHDAGEARPGLDARRELVPAALAVLLVAATVIDHDIGDGADFLLVQLLDQALERCLVAVL